jgi:hypothetical protein
MKIYTPLSVAIRVVGYSLLMVGVAEILRFDAVYPMEEGYYGEISLTEISQEIILFTLFVLYLMAGRKYKAIQPVTNILSLIFLASFIREFNFLISWWLYPVLAVLLVTIGLVLRDFKKLKHSTVTFFSLPASGWFFSGFLITYIVSRMFGRSSFWRILYDDSSYRLAKAATEEGLELTGDVLLLISAIELFIIIGHLKREEKK